MARKSMLLYIPSSASFSPTMAFIREDFPTPVFPVTSILIDSDPRLEDRNKKCNCCCKGGKAY